jgi:hypothetical protein
MENTAPRNLRDGSRRDSGTTRANRYDDVPSNLGMELPGVPRRVAVFVVSGALVVAGALTRKLHRKQACRASPPRRPKAWTRQCLAGACANSLMKPLTCTACSSQGIAAWWSRPIGPPYNRETKHYLNSATKAVLSALVGIAVHEGWMRENARVLSYLPSYAMASHDPRWRAITVRDLLTMSSGISWRQSPPDNTSDEMGHSSDWVGFILRRPMAADPGKITNYSNGDSHLLSPLQMLHRD